MERRIGISIGAFQKKHGDAEALRIARRLGADAVDFSTSDKRRYDSRVSGSRYDKSDGELFEYYSSLRRVAESEGLWISQTHGRMRMYTLDETDNRGHLENARRDLLVAAALGAPVCVMHGVTTGSMGKDAAPEQMRELNRRAFCDVLRYAKEYGVKVATETFGDALDGEVCDFFGQWDEFLRAYREIKEASSESAYFGICMDTGHTNKAHRFGHPLPADAIRALSADDLLCLHLNDNDGMTDQHKAPLTGNIDWTAVLDALDEIGYAGVYNMELALTRFGPDFLEETASFAIKLLRYQFRLRDGV